MEQCSGHAQLLGMVAECIKAIGEHASGLKTSETNYAEIFERLRGIQSSIDQRAFFDDEIKSLCDMAKYNRENIHKLQMTVSNGLTSKTSEIAATVQRLEYTITQMERKREIKEATDAAGIGGFFALAWGEFKKKCGWIIIGIIIWLLAWGFMKSVVYHEYPFAVKKAPPPATQSEQPVPADPELLQQ